MEGIRKVFISVADLGTRMLPATDASKLGEAFSEFVCEVKA